LVYLGAKSWASSVWKWYTAMIQHGNNKHTWWMFDVWIPGAAWFSSMAARIWALITSSSPALASTAYVASEKTQRRWQMNKHNAAAAYDEMWVFGMSISGAVGSSPWRCRRWIERVDFSFDIC
jgi:hypothetical protein